MNYCTMHAVYFVLYDVRCRLSPQEQGCTVCAVGGTSYAHAGMQDVSSTLPASWDDEKGDLPAQLDKLIKGLTAWLYHGSRIKRALDGLANSA